MKCAAFVLVVGLVAANLMAQPQKRASKNENDAANHTHDTITVVNNEEPTAQRQTPENGAQHWYASSEWWIVIIAGITAGFICWQARETARATRAMRDSLPFQQRAADAALLNARAAIYSVRPWVSVVIEHNNGVFAFKAANFGKTPAELIAYSSDTTCAESPNSLPVPAKYGIERVPPLKFLIPSGKKIGGATIDLASYDMPNILANDPGMKKELSQGKVFIFFLRILYKNTLANVSPEITPHETRICFWYSPLMSIGPQIGGPEDYNSHT